MTDHSSSRWSCACWRSDHE